MPSKEELRAILQQRLKETVARMNSVLAGNGVKSLQPVLARLGRGQQLPYWYEGLKNEGTLPSLQPKTVGSVIEMLLLAVLETHTFAGMSLPPLTISPARGIDLPDLDLGVKSPSENYETSEPLFSPYERLFGAGHDILVLLTDLQTAKRTGESRLQIINWHYLRASQVADLTLCRIARKHRQWLVHDDEARAQRIFRFLAYVNKNDWRARRLLLLTEHLRDDDQIRALIKRAKSDFRKLNGRRLRGNNLPLPDEELEALTNIARLNDLHLAIAGGGLDGHTA